MNSYILPPYGTVPRYRHSTTATCTQLLSLRTQCERSAMKSVGHRNLISNLVPPQQNARDETSASDRDGFTQCEPRGNVPASGTAQTATPPDTAPLNFNLQVKLTVELACLSSAYTFPTFIGLWRLQMAWQYQERRIIFVLTWSRYWLLRSDTSKSNLQLGNIDFMSVAFQLYEASSEHFAYKPHWTCVFDMQLHELTSRPLVGLIIVY